MKRVIPFVFCLLFSFSISAQLELAPRTINRPALLRTDNATDFCLGLQELGESSFNDFARLRFMNSQLQSGGSGVIYSPSTRYWDIARKSGSGTQADDRLNFYNSVGGNILTLTGDDKVNETNSIFSFLTLYWRNYF